MSAGTLKLTNGSTAVTGTGTNFTVDLNAADFIVVTVGGTTHSLAIDTVTNTTELVLSAPFNGPTTDSVAWQAVPRKTMLRVTAELNKQVNEALRLANENSINWQAVLSSTDTVSVILPDGTMLTGLSWRKINDLLKALDVEHLDATAAQIHTDAQQVADDKPLIAQAKSDAIAAKDDAVLARDDAETAKKASETAQEKSETAQVKSEAAQKAAEQAAATVQPENLLQNANNLDDLTDKPAARQNLDVFSKEEIADMLPGFLGQIDWQEMRTALEPGTAPRDGQEVDQAGIFADLYAKALAGKLPTCTEAEWQADPLNRGCYVLESSPGKMRLPDDNGVQPGSLKIPVHVGDGGDSSVNGKIGASALPNITGVILGSTRRGVYDFDTDDVSGAIEREALANGIVATSTTSASVRYQLKFNANSSNKMYQDGVTEVRANRMQGCWTVRFAAKATNGGSIDALALASAIAAGDAELLAKIIATNNRIDYALIAPEAEMVKNTRALYENPFGNDVPVICLAEFYHPTLAKWVSSSCVWTASNAGYGLRAAYAAGEGISLSAMPTGFALANNGNGASQAVPANYTANALVRIHVWKVAVSS
ncbi:hypothetical protein RIN60_14725 [Kluyvera cryocrescens]|uniref:hypothetical protein n=1 Tax=Kluyvera cryocrescens TaxID=580 RepID=UPI0028BD9589|nr:hypothetical protein [Kluyvera cryocrescens]WNN70329.1 hypothetical protein RIN60_14725 [Kluyvera cryocrescens]